jgi:uncharacterized membrane protein
MPTGRLEAFSDGVVAILITIMVLELKVPEGDTFSALRGEVPVLASYALSFVYLGIYWNNHHHMLQVTERVDGLVLWANLHLLFWLSLVPFTTEWLGREFGSDTCAAYGFVLLAAALAFFGLQRAILRAQGEGSRLEQALGRDRKGRLSPVAYSLAIVLAFVEPWAAVAVFVAVALAWLVPDRRFERVVSSPSPSTAPRT